MEHKQHRLPPEALLEFRRIYQEEFGEDITDDQAEEMGLRVLRLFKLLLEPAPPRIVLSEDKIKALRYIRDRVIYMKTQPTSRGIAKAMGRFSSRTGMKMLNHLIERGLVHKDDGKVWMDTETAERRELR